MIFHFYPRTFSWEVASIKKKGRWVDGEDGGGVGIGGEGRGGGGRGGGERGGGGREGRGGGEIKKK